MWFAHSRKSKRDPLGPAGERAAQLFLKQQKFRVLATNVRTPVGEADLVCVAPDRRTLVIVEVKARRRSGTANAANTIAPEANVHAAKRRRLASIARHIAHTNNWNDRPVRLDVVAVEWPTDTRKPVIRHFEDVR